MKLEMPADPNMGGFHPQEETMMRIPSMLENWDMVSFQPGAMNLGSSDQIGSSVGPFYGNSGGVGISGPAGPSSSSGYRDPVGRIGPEASGLSLEWTGDELIGLKQGLIIYADEHGAMKYIKIAAMLPRKTARDVALRCRRMTENSKRLYAGKRICNKKFSHEKMVNSCSSTNGYIFNSSATASYSPMIPQVNQNHLLSCEVPALDGATQQLLDENNQILHQISANLVTCKVQENISLFCHTRNNITNILNNMSNMPGIMRQMPPLPMSVNEELLNAILSDPNLAFMFGDPGIGLEMQQQDLL